VPRILRKIRTQKWASKGYKWLGEGELQADALVDLATKGNELSIYLVNDDNSNLEQVVAAMAVANTQRIDNFDYALFDDECLSRVGMKIKVTHGNTPDGEVNGLHRDLEELTVEKLIALADVIKSKARRERVPEKRVRTLVANGIVSGQINLSKLQLNHEEMLKLNREIERAKSRIRGGQAGGRLHSAFNAGVELLNRVFRLKR
jgi:hypothetical protein